jgi:hypothetical protein
LGLPSADGVTHFRRRGGNDGVLRSVVPVLLGSGENLFVGINMPALGYQCTEHVSTELATHIVLTKRAGQ